MNEIRPQNDTEQPGKTRTSWHTLLVQLLKFVLEGYCDVRDELLVGKVPLRIDVLLLRMRQHRPTQRAKRNLHRLLKLLNDYTFVEFKGPTDALEPGDLLRFLGCVFLWGDQQSQRPARREITLVVLAPSINRAFRSDARFFGGTIRRRGVGQYFVTGLPFPLWLLETDALDMDDPVMALMSRDVLDHTPEVIQALRDQGHDDLVDYTVQQVSQFQHQEDFAMRHSKTKEMEKFSKGLLETVLKVSSLEDRLRDVSPEDILNALDEKRRRVILEKALSEATEKRKHK